MRTNRGRAADLYDDSQDDTRRARRPKPGGADLAEARAAWEPIVCPSCGTDHSDVLSIRLRRAGRAIEARCSGCGAIAARYAAGVWNS